MKNITALAAAGVVLWLGGCSNTPDDPAEGLTPDEVRIIDDIATEPDACAELQAVFDAADTAGDRDRMAYADHVMSESGCY